ncbi:MAG: SDR family oxidoreductase [Desulfohalobiaceae bacterium]|nr:SDR family oxidoreductase [Desulfohalobiaceae bacterium]
MAQVLVTGSNRGIGLEWVRQYAAEGNRVFATCRHPREAIELRALAERFEKVSLHRLDVTRTDEINAVAVELLSEPIDILVNNAGIYLEKYRDVGLNRLNYEDWVTTFRVNTLGPVRVTEAFADHVARSKERKVVITSTHMASIADIAVPGAYYYRSTKAALNAVMEGITHELKNMDIALLLLHPGHVLTRMGGTGTSLMPDKSVEGMRILVDQFTMKDTGRFFRYDGVEMPW